MFLVLTSGLALTAAVFAVRMLTSGRTSTGGTPEMLEFSRSSGSGLSVSVLRLTAGLLSASGAAAFVLFLSLLFIPSMGRDGAARAAFSFMAGAFIQVVSALLYSRTLYAGVLGAACALKRSVPEALTAAFRRAGAFSILSLLCGLAAVVSLSFIAGGPYDIRGAAGRICGFCSGSAFAVLFMRLAGGPLCGAYDGEGGASALRGMPDGAMLAADVLDSASAETIAAMMLGAALWPVLGLKAALFPLFSRSCSIAACAAGTARVLSTVSDDYSGRLDKGLYVTGGAALSGLLLGCFLLLDGNMWFFAASVIGLTAAGLFAFSARYYGEYRPLLSAADGGASSGGQSVSRILAAGFESASVPYAVIAAGMVGAYYCGIRGFEGHSSGGQLMERAGGLYGIAMSVIGALSISGYTMAAGIAGDISCRVRELCEMTAQDEGFRLKGGVLASAGLSGASISGWRFSGGVLVSVLLFFTYISETGRLTGSSFGSVNFAGAEVFSGGFIGAGAIAVFCALLFGGRRAQAGGKTRAFRRFFITVSPVLALPAAAFIFSSSGRGTGVVPAVLVPVILCGGCLAAAAWNAAASLDRSGGGKERGAMASSLKEAAEAMSAMIKFLPAAALLLAALFV